MSAGPVPIPQPISATEMGGRIRELQRQVAEGSARSAVLAGENANLLELLRLANDEIKRLTPPASAPATV